MARSAAKIGADMRRSLRRVLELERMLVEAHAEGDAEKARATIDHLKRVVSLTDRLVRDFLRAVRITPIEGSRNPGSGEGSDDPEA